MTIVTRKKPLVPNLKAIPKNDSDNEKHHLVIPPKPKPHNLDNAECSKQEVANVGNGTEVKLDRFGQNRHLIA